MSIIHEKGIWVTIIFMIIIKKPCRGIYHLKMKCIGIFTLCRYIKKHTKMRLVMSILLICIRCFVVRLLNDKHFQRRFELGFRQRGQIVIFSLSNGFLLILRIGLFIPQIIYCNRTWIFGMVVQETGD